MKQRAKKPMGFLTGVLIFALSFASLASAVALFSAQTGITQVASAKDGSGSGSSGSDDSDDDDDEDEDDDEDDRDDDSDDDSDKDDDEDDDRDDSDDRDDRKRSGSVKTEDVKNIQRTTSNSGSGRGGNSEDDDKDEDDKLDDKSKQSDRVEQLTKRIEKAESDIARKEGEGVDTRAALALISEAKAKLSTLKGLVSTNRDEVEKLFREGKELADRARGRVLRVAEKTNKEIGKVEKRIVQTESKIASLVVAGGDAAPFKTALDDAKVKFAEAKLQISQGLPSGYVLLETTERQVKRIKDRVEMALFSLGIGDDLSDDEDDVADVIERLEEAAGFDDSDSRRAEVRQAIAGQTEAKEKIRAFLNDADSRSTFVQSLIGPKFDSLEGVNAEIAQNAARIAKLRSVADSTEDVEVKSLLVSAAEDLEAENAQLTGVVASKSEIPSLLGWLFRLL